MKVAEPQWTYAQREALAVLQVVPWRWRGRAAELPVGAVATRDPARQDPGLATPPAAAAQNRVMGWSLLASAQWREVIEGLRWYRQLCRYAAELPSTETPGRNPVILLGTRRLPLDGHPPRPSPGVKRELYLALRDNAG